MVVSLIGPAQHPFVQRVLLVAAYAGVSLKLINITAEEIKELMQQAAAAASTNNNNNNNNKRAAAAHPKLTKADLLRLNCSPLLTFPILKTDEGYMFDYGSIIRYICRMEVQLNALEKLNENANAGTAGGNASAIISILSSQNPNQNVENKKKYPHPQYPVLYAMYGHSMSESALVDSWIDYTTARLDYFFSDAQTLNKKNNLTSNGSGASGKKERQELLSVLEGIELRLAAVRDGRQTAIRNATLAANPQGGNASTTNPANMSETSAAALNDYDDFLEDLQNLSSARQGRLSSVYNVAGSIKQKLNQLNTENEALPSPRMSAAATGGQTPRSSLFMGGANNNNNNNASTSGITPRASLASARHTHLNAAAGNQNMANLNFLRSLKKDLFFLVGESLTAADLTVAMALYLIFQAKSSSSSSSFLQFDAANILSKEDLAAYPYCVEYYKSILNLPIATDIRKALSISI